MPVHVDHQPEILIQLFKGECAQKEDNNLMWERHLDGIQSAPCGASQVEVASSTDVNENLNVSAQNTSTGGPNHISITNENGRLLQTETDHVMPDAEKYHGRDDSGEDESNKTKIKAQQVRQQHSSKQPTSMQVVQEREKKKRGKVEEEKEIKKEMKKKEVDRKGERPDGEDESERRRVEEVEDKEVDEDVMDWTMVTRSARQRKSQRQGVVSEGNKISRSIDKAIQIFVKTDARHFRWRCRQMSKSVTL